MTVLNYKKLSNHRSHVVSTWKYFVLIAFTWTWGDLLFVIYCIEHFFFSLCDFLLNCAVFRSGIFLLYVWYEYKKTDFVFHIRLFFCDKNCFLTCNDTYICIRDMPYFNFCFCLVTNHDVFVSFVCLMIIKSVWGELEVSISVISFDCLQYLVYMN